MPKRFHLKRRRLVEAVLPNYELLPRPLQPRLVAMAYACLGELTAAQIAKKVGVSRRQFFNWVSAFKKGGVNKLLARRHGGGAPARVRGAVLKEFRAGLKAGRWKRAKEIQQWLLREHQVKLSLKGVYYWRRKLRGA